MSANRWAMVLGAALLAGAGIWYQWFRPQTLTPEPLAETPAEAPTPLPAPPSDYPVPPPAAEAPALPPLDDSDQAFRDALVALPGAGPLAAWLMPDLVIRRIVVSVDNLARERLAMKLRPLKPVDGAFLVDNAASGFAIRAANAARYSAAVAVLQALDSEALVKLYFAWYPLFQQAYRDLGYPQGRFNNRLVEVLDHLITTPDIGEPVLLVRPKVYYEYFEPAQQVGSAGRQLLWRIGEDHRRAVIGKLADLRARVTAGVVNPAAAPKAAQPAVAEASAEPAADAAPAALETMPPPE